MENDCWKQPLKEFHKNCPTLVKQRERERRTQTHYAIFEPIFLFAAAHRPRRSSRSGGWEKIICRLIIISGMNKQESERKESNERRCNGASEAVIVIFKCVFWLLFFVFFCVCVLLSFWIPHLAVCGVAYMESTWNAQLFRLSFHRFDLRYLKCVHISLPASILSCSHSLPRLPAHSSNFAYMVFDRFGYARNFRFSLLKCWVRAI